MQGSSLVYLRTKHSDLNRRNLEIYMHDKRSGIRNNVKELVLIGRLV